MQPQYSTPEEWRPVVGWEGWYEVSNLGRVRRMRAVAGTHAGRILKEMPVATCLPGRLYPFVSLSRHGHWVSRNVHRLVAEAFLEPCSLRSGVNHINGIKKDNRSINLEWATSVENMRHASSMGLMARGERHGLAKLTADDVRTIRNMRGQVSQRQLAKQFGVSRQNIGYIQRLETWRHI
jgi:hypothetical protein